MNTHRNDVWRTDCPLHDKHLQMPRHNFNAYAKFTIIEVIIRVENSQPVRTSRFWILKLQTLSQRGLNLFILKALLGPFGSHIKTPFHTPSCSFNFLLNLITWMSYAKFI